MITNASNEVTLGNGVILGDNVKLGNGVVFKNDITLTVSPIYARRKYVINITEHGMMQIGCETHPVKAWAKLGPVLARKHNDVSWWKTNGEWVLKLARNAFNNKQNK